MSEPAKLKDVLSYTPDSYFSKDEIAFIRNTFKDNPTLLGIIRKVMLPTVADPNLPMEEFAHDAYLAGKSWSQIPVAERTTMMVARQEAIEFVLGGLIKLKNIANIREETPQEAVLRKEKDSTR